jgi:photosystem II stability/assembly factor-like uncharacterized protein
VTRTYVISQDPGKVHRLDSLAGSWVDISLPLTFNGQLLDVKTGPDVPDTVITVGSIVQGLGLFGIYRSVNAGAVWTFPTGNYTTAAVKNWFQLSWPDQSHVFASAESGYIAWSNDSGATFTLTTGFPTPTGAADTGNAKCLHFISPTTGVVGFQGSLFSTTDTGATWTWLNGGAPLTSSKTITEFLGVHMDATGLVITALGREAIYRSTDGGASFTLVHDFTSSEGRHLTWISDSELWAIGDKDLRMQSTDAGVTWTVLNPYNPVTGAFQLSGNFYNINGGFYGSNLTTMFTSDSGATGTVSDTMPGIVKAIWTMIDASVCYDIESCLDRSVHHVVGQDLSAYVGEVIQVGNGTCWTVIGVTECINPVSVIIIDSFATCNECLNPPVTCYILTDCNILASPIERLEVSTNLSAYVEQVVQIEGSDKCWNVSQTVGCDCPIEVTVTYSSTTCDLCPPTVPETIRLRKVAPGQPPTCDPELFKTVNCTYAEAWYRKVLSLRFGINVCCDYDLDSAFVNWEVLNLQKLYDPLVCCPQLASPSFNC